MYSVACVVCVCAKLELNFNGEIISFTRTRIHKNTLMAQRLHTHSSQTTHIWGEQNESYSLQVSYDLNYKVK